MAKSDTWPGRVAMEPLSNMDSAGSCDSVISMNSGFSEDSMEHLSAEERACLMYLEETIEALEVQEDSGLSNDEPETLSQVGKTDETRVRDNENEDDVDSSTPTLPPTENTSSKPKPQAEPAAEASAACEVGPSPHQPKMLYLSKDEDGAVKIVSTGGAQMQNSEIDLSLIPPPLDFMDEPGLPDEPRDLPPSAGISNHQPVDLEQLRQRASMKVTQESEKELPGQSSFPGSTSPLLSPSLEATEHKSPPVVAPKPKKLPANIILKSHKAAPALESVAAHSAPAGSERMLMDPQKVRIEALRKLGLLKGDEVDAGPVLSPKHSPQARRSRAAPPSPLSPASHTPPPPSHTHSPSHATLQPPAPVSPLVLSKPPAVQTLHIVPAPAAFRDPDGPDKEAPPVKDTSEPAEPGEDLREESGRELWAAGGADSRHPLPAHEPSADSQKLPRSGISVLICPRSENEDKRRDALKRLGLVRD